MASNVAAGQSVPLITPDLVALDVDFGDNPRTVISHLAHVVAGARGGDAEVLANDAWWREERSPTGMPGGFAIPHCRSAGTLVPSLGFARLRRPVDFGAHDAPADIVFLIAMPLGSGAEHLRLLARLARALVRPDFVTTLRTAATCDDVVRLVGGQVESPARQAQPGRPAGGAMGHDPVDADPQSASHSGWWVRRRQRGID